MCSCLRYNTQLIIRNDSRIWKMKTTHTHTHTYKYKIKIQNSKKNNKHKTNKNQCNSWFWHYLLLNRLPHKTVPLNGCLIFFWYLNVCWEAFQHWNLYSRIHRLLEIQIISSYKHTSHLKMKIAYDLEQLEINWSNAC